MSADDNVVRKLALLKLAEELGSVTKACQSLGVSRDTFYRAKQAFESAGSEGLRNISRRKPNFKNRVSSAVEASVIRLSLSRPSYGQVRIAKELDRLGIRISPAGVRCIWQRHNCETASKRLQLRDSNKAIDRSKLTDATASASTTIVISPSLNITDPAEVSLHQWHGEEEKPKSEQTNT